MGSVVEAFARGGTAGDLVRSAVPSYAVLLAAMGVAVAVLFAGSLCVGPVTISPGRVVAALFAADDAPFTVIVQEIRLPRAILGAVVGASLGLSGAALQGLLRNPLAEPALIGTSSSAALGEETVASLGVSLSRLRFRLVVGTVFAVGAGVAVAGSIGFIGLVVPHLLRSLVGHRPSRVLIAIAIGGAVLLLAADIGVRAIATYPEFKLGVLTSLVGAPFFLVLVLKTRHRAV